MNDKILTEKHLENYSKVLLWGLKNTRRSPFKPNDIVLIRFDLSATRLAEILGRDLLKMGINPVIRMNPTPSMEHNLLNIANKKQLTFNTPGEIELYNNINGLIFLHAPESIAHLKDINPKKINKFLLSKKYLKEVMEKREQLGEFGWTLCIFPTYELAKYSGLTYNEYAKQIVDACFLSHESPIDQWKNIYSKIKEIKKWLNSIEIKYLHIESENTDLIINFGKNRKWVGLSGHNVPSFEIFTSPDWRGTNGIYYANQPSFHNGNYVDKIKLEFKNGEIIKSEADFGDKFLKSKLLTDVGASRIGEFSLTDKRFSKIDKFMANTLFDENYGGEFGNCHIAIGSSYTESYLGQQKKLSKKIRKYLGFNESSIHWDLVNTERKRVSACSYNGIYINIYEDGKFKL